MWILLEPLYWKILLMNATISWGDYLSGLRFGSREAFPMSFFHLADAGPQAFHFEVALVLKSSHTR